MPSPASESASESAAESAAAAAAAARSKRLVVLVLFTLWLAFYSSVTLFTPPLLDDADSVHAEVAREMLLRHDCVTLYANGIRYLEKAPLLYWTMAASMKLFGVSAAAARVPLALAVLALTLLLARFAAQAFASPSQPENTRAGLYAGLLTLSAPGLFLFTRITIPDAMVCLWLSLALYAFWQTERPPTRVSHGPASGTWVASLPSAPPALLPCLLFALACALNVLTKGLIGAVFPLAIVSLYLVLTRGPRAALTRLTQFNLLPSLAVFLIVAAPWHVLIALANPTQGHPGGLAFALHRLAGQAHWSVALPTDGNVHGWAWFYFVNEQVLRYLNLRVPRDYDTVPLALFWGLLLVWLMPWSAFLAAAFARALPLRTTAWRKAFRTHTLGSQQKTLLLLAVWAAVPMLFFSLSTRQEYYVLPSIPALILLLAHWLGLSTATAPHLPDAPHLDSERWASHRSATALHARTPSASVSPASVEGPRSARIFARIFARVFARISARIAARTAARIATLLLVLGTLASATALYLALHSRPPAPDTDLASLLQQNPADYALSMGHFLDLNARALGLFRLPLLLTAVVAFCGPLANWLLRRRYARPHAANLSLAAATFLFLLAAHLGLRTFAPVLSSQPLAATIAPLLKPQDLIVLHGEYESGSTLGFYLRRPGLGGQALHILEGRSSNLWYGSFFPDAPAIFETRESLAEKWRSPQRIFLWEDPHDPDRPAMNLTPAYVIAQGGGKRMLSNQP